MWAFFFFFFKALSLKCWIILLVGSKSNLHLQLEFSVFWIIKKSAQLPTNVQ